MANTVINTVEQADPSERKLGRKGAGRGQRRSPRARQVGRTRLKISRELMFHGNIGNPRRSDAEYKFLVESNRDPLNGNGKVMEMCCLVFPKTKHPELNRTDYGNGCIPNHS